MDPTLFHGTKVEVRGGVIEVASGRSKGEKLAVGMEPKIVGRHADCALVLADKSVSGMHLEVAATSNGIRVRDLGSRNGTFLDEHRIEAVVFSSPASIRCGETTLEVQVGDLETVPLSRSHHFGDLIGASRPMRALFEQLRRVASTTVSVLVTGETGTGKELVAAAIHKASPRAKKPFVVLDCTTIPAQLAESALFGHEKGAFTGADAKRTSPFVEANGGTIFLDEVGELPLDLQPKLLRALEQRTIKAVGSHHFQAIDVRVVAATHRDLAPASCAGRFREDLFFRIARTHVRVPPFASA